MNSIIRKIISTIVTAAITVAIAWACTRAYYDSKPKVIQLWEKYFSNKMKGTRDGVKNVGGRMIHIFKSDKKTASTAN